MIKPILEQFARWVHVTDLFFCDCCVMDSCIIDGASTSDDADPDEPWDITGCPDSSIQGLGDGIAVTGKQ